MGLSANQKILKLLYFLSVVRWYNVLLIFIAQYSLALFVFGPQYSFRQIILDGTLHLMIFATVFTIAGAFIINSFYDSDKDLVNHPKSALVGRVIGQNFLANTYFLFNGIALLFAFFTTKKIFLFYIVYIGLCWFYSHKLQKKPIVRELSASILTMAPLIAVWIHYGVWDWKLLYFFATLLTILFTKDVVKDISGHKGNLIFGYNTVVVVAGKKNVKYGLIILNASIFLLFLIIYNYQVSRVHISSNQNLIIGSSISLVTNTCITLLGISKLKNKYQMMDLALKFLLLFHIGLLVFTFLVNQLVTC